MAVLKNDNTWKALESLCEVICSSTRSLEKTAMNLETSRNFLEGRSKKLWGTLLESWQTFLDVLGRFADSKY